MYKTYTAINVNNQFLSIFFFTNTEKMADHARERDKGLSTKIHRSTLSKRLLTYTDESATNKAANGAGIILKMCSSKKELKKKITAT